MAVMSFSAARNQTILMVVAVTPCDVAPPLSPANAGTHGGAYTVGNLMRPVFVSQLPQVVWSWVPFALASEYSWGSSGLSARLVALAGFLADVVAVLGVRVVGHGAERGDDHQHEGDRAPALQRRELGPGAGGSLMVGHLGCR